LQRIVVALGLVTPAFGAAPAGNSILGADEVAEMLRREPVTSQTWPVCCDQLRHWIDDKSHVMQAAFQAGRNFVKGQADTTGMLPPPLVDDPFAWYALGQAYLDEWHTDPAARPQPSATARRPRLRRLSGKASGRTARSRRRAAISPWQYCC
jgi:hypothetical protein